MRITKPTALALSAACGLALAIGALAIADTPAEQPPMQLPAGWTMEDMQAMIEAGTPGKMHEHLAKDVGTWHAECKSWMGPDTEPIPSSGTTTVTPLMDGRYIQVEMKCEMPGMGMYNGMGIYGYDNFEKKFVSIWIDNHGTGIMKGEGELSEDGKTLTWDFTGNCPIAKKPITIREIETWTGPNTKTLDMFGTDPKSGKEFQMMSIELTKE